ncbi:MAG: transcription termination factor Rho, partial [Candidatus Shapirobacteria bacterium]
MRKVTAKTEPDVVAPKTTETSSKQDVSLNRVEIDKPISNGEGTPVIKEVTKVVEEVKTPVIKQAEVRYETPRIMTPPPMTGVEQIVGCLDLLPDGSGMIRPKFTPTPKDAYLPSMIIRRYGLRMGDMITGWAKAPKESEKHWAMVKLNRVNDEEVREAVKRVDFRDLVPIYPLQQLKLETETNIVSTRIIDLFSPVGFGQRGMIVSPPKAGKTTLLKEIADGVAKNYPNVHLMAVLVGERPEEVTDMQRFIKGEVVASHFDQKPEDQTKAAEIAIERAKRLVEMGKDVFIVFDSITRLARAYNLAIPTSGRTLSGGFDPAALYPSKRFFGAARKIENGGSLTIIGTALVDTGSKMDDLVFEEFKGTGNSELRLERELAERRI